jgi:hypothetical protein
MKSPFPGMNPYLEARWSNVHILMVSAIASLLKPSLPEGLEARPEEDVRIETIVGERLRGIRPDLAVIETPIAAKPEFRGARTAVIDEPIRIEFHRGPIVLRNVEVVDTRDRDRVVTIIEVLSPWNKLPGQSNKDYIEKHNAREEEGTNWVEIDLLRSTRSHLKVTWADLKPEKRLGCLVLTYRAADDELLGYPFSIRDPLPKVRVPLREGDDEVILNLQAVMERVYRDGPFDSIDYSKSPEPPLSPLDAEWAAGLLANQPARNQSRVDRKPTD